MRIAIPYINGMINGHFGHSEQFKIYEVTEDDRVVSAMVLPTNGAGHGALASFLTNIHTNVVLCGGIGPGAIEALRAAGMHIYAGCEGEADTAVHAFLSGFLQETTVAPCNHHHEENGCGHEGACSCHHKGD